MAGDVGVDFRFPNHTKALLIGPPGFGKSTWFYKYLANKNVLCQEPPTRCIYFYSDVTPDFATLKDMNLVDEFRQGVPPPDFIEEVKELSQSERVIVGIDDKGANLDEVVYRLLTVVSRHYKIQVFIMVHSLYSTENKMLRPIALACNLLVLLPNPREPAFVRTMATQMFPYMNPKNLMKAYLDSTETRIKNRRMGGYLCLRVEPFWPSKYRVFTNIFPSEAPIKILDIN